jgi:hypothetical protein
MLYGNWQSESQLSNWIEFLLEQIYTNEKEFFLLHRTSKPKSFLFGKKFILLLVIELRKGEAVNLGVVRGQLIFYLEQNQFLKFNVRSK